MKKQMKAMTPVMSGKKAAPAKNSPKAAAKPEAKEAVKDPSHFSSRKVTPKKSENDVRTPGKRPEGKREKLENIRI